ncbi:MAG: protein translocase subunit SecD [Rhodospirillales bacterium]|nr:protein translocase subunit SecD [Rhodospirillales bacterium]
MLYFAKWKISLILAVCLFGIVLAAPNLLTSQMAESLPDWMPKKQISLGLDLQGGSHLLLEVEVAEVLKERLESTVDAIRTVLRDEKIGYRGLGIDGDSAVVTIRTPADVDKARQLVRALDSGTETVSTDEGQIRVTLTEVARRERVTSAIDQSIEIVRRRIDETGVREPTIQRQGEERILVQLPGLDDPERIKRLLGKTAKMTFHLVQNSYYNPEDAPKKAPAGTMLVLSAEQTDSAGRPIKMLLKKRVVVSGENLTDSQPTFSESRPVVSFDFDSLGAKKFGKATQENVNRQIAILLDGKVISAPRINEPILGGSGVISGSFTTQEARDLALLLRAGALPAPLTILEERTVGPGMGADAIAAGKIASIIGMIGVIIFMVVTYSLFGVLADIALIANIVLIIAALSFLQATLTLPGIAGIVLTIGMAVDANVLVFERIREELRAGRTPISAIDAGYKRAITTIIDANVTTLIAAVLLFEFGSGPIRGFAVTLAIGILSSLFTATMLTRLMVAGWLRNKRLQTLPL